MSGSRLDAARERLAASGAAVLLVGPGADLRYLTGYDVAPSERLTLLVLPVDGEAALVVPELEAPRAAAAVGDDLVARRSWEETEDVIDVVAHLVREHTDGGGVLAVQDRLWSGFLLALQDTLPAASWIPGSDVTAPLRRVKDDDELAALRAAAAAIDRVHAAVPDLLAVGRSERAVAADVGARVREDHDEVGFVIVAAGENAASPHHEPGERRLVEGDLVVVDIGGPRGGYWSDCTRTYALGPPAPDVAAAYEVLEQAQHAAVSAVTPGARAEEVDAAARRPLRHTGLADHFVHRTGHGIGLEGHEQPWIVAGNSDELERGNVFSVEPGVYVAGRYGARIEDIVAVTDDGVERLNARPRALEIVEP